MEVASEEWEFGAKDPSAWLRVSWDVNASRIHANITNVSRSEIVVCWDRAVFIAADGTPVQPIATQEQRLKPAETARVSLEFPLQARLVPVMPGIASVDRDDAESFARSQIGSTVVIFLPVESRGRERSYQFHFEVTAFTIESFAGA